MGKRWKTMKSIFTVSLAGRRLVNALLADISVFLSVSNVKSHALWSLPSEKNTINSYKYLAREKKNTIQYKMKDCTCYTIHT